MGTSAAVWGELGNRQGFGNFFMQFARFARILLCFVSIVAIFAQTTEGMDTATEQKVKEFEASEARIGGKRLIE
ncbi:MAG TPA: hypothetical protein VHS96_15800 [Bacteroidia bacterium]|nr:hypothetical protein [Bacteroidia bacterium]